MLAIPARPPIAIVLIAIAVFISPAAFATDTVVVCPSLFRESLQAWLKYRQAQGHSIQLIHSERSAAGIRRRIQQIAAENPGQLKAVLLVGDSRPDHARQIFSPEYLVPAHYVPAQVITKYGGESHIASDNGYADLDEDGVPDVAVGRLTVDSPAELAVLTRKIVSYESNADFGSWRRRINLIAGVGGFGAMIDRVVESTTKMFLTAGIPSAFQTSMTQASWTSPYCPDPRRFGQATLNRLNEGCLFWVYMGHGQPHALDWLQVPDGRFPILTSDEIPKIQCRAEWPIALFFSCYAGAFDAAGDCLAEEMLANQHGPVAVVGGTRVTMPYAMSVMGTGMLKECFENRCATLGEIFLASKRALAEDQAQDNRRKMLDTMAGLMTAGRHDLAAERREHLHLFNLLGDPLLRMRYPEEVKVTAPAQAAPGTEIKIAATTPVAGRAVVELIVRRDRMTFKPPRRDKFEEDDESLAAYDRVYEEANDPRLVSFERQVEAGEFTEVFSLPKTASGSCHIRVYIEGGTSFAMGSTDIQISLLAHAKEAPVSRLSASPAKAGNTIERQ